MRCIKNLGDLVGWQNIPESQTAPRDENAPETLFLWNYSKGLAVESLCIKTISISFYRG